MPHGQDRNDIRVEAVTGNKAAVQKINNPLAKLIRHLINGATDAWLLTNMLDGQPASLLDWTKDEHGMAMTFAGNKPVSSLRCYPINSTQMQGDAACFTKKYRIGLHVLACKIHHAGVFYRHCPHSYG